MADDTDGRGTPPGRVQSTGDQEAARASAPDDAAAPLVAWHVTRAAVDGMKVPSFNFTLLKYTNSSSVLLIITELATVMGVAVTTLKTALKRSGASTYVIDHQQHMALLRAIGAAMQNSRSVAAVKARHLALPLVWDKLPAAVIKYDALRLLMMELSRHLPPRYQVQPPVGTSARYLTDPARNPEVHPAVAGFQTPAVPPATPDPASAAALHPVRSGFPPPVAVPCPPRSRTRLREGVSATEPDGDTVSHTSQRSNRRGRRPVGADRMAPDDDAALASEQDDEDYHPSESSASDDGGDFLEGQGALVIQPAGAMIAAGADMPASRTNPTIFVADSFAPAGRRYDRSPCIHIVFIVSAKYHQPYFMSAVTCHDTYTS